MLVHISGHGFKVCMCAQLHTYMLGLALTLAGAGDMALLQPHICVAGLGVLSGSYQPLGWAISKTQT